MNLFGLKAHGVVVAAVLLGLVSILQAPAAAQTGDSRTLVEGQTVAWSGPWIIDNTLTSSGDGFDLLAVGSANAIVGVGSYGFPIAGSELRDVAIEAFAGELGLQ